MPKTGPSRLVLIDLDGTITRKDTYIEFIKFCYPGLPFYFGFLLLSPVLILNRLGIISGQWAKEKVLTYFYRGMNEAQFKELGYKFSTLKLPGFIRKVAADEILMQKGKGAKIVVVTASFSVWIEGWCEKEEIDLIATEYEVINGILTGKIKGRNCKGFEKIRRIKEKYNIDKVDEIYAYGNSRSDRKMLNIADVKYMRWRKID